MTPTPKWLYTRPAAAASRRARPASRERAAGRSQARCVGRPAAGHPRWVGSKSGRADTDNRCACCAALRRQRHAAGMSGHQAAQAGASVGASQVSSTTFDQDLVEAMHLIMDVKDFL